MAIVKKDFVFSAGTTVSNTRFGIAGELTADYVFDAYIIPVQWIDRKMGPDGNVMRTGMPVAYENVDGELKQIATLPKFSFELAVGTDHYEQMYAAMKSQPWAEGFEDA